MPDQRPSQKTDQKRVAIVGASDKPDRYSHKAFMLLRQYGHEPVPISPNVLNVEGVATVKSIDDVSGAIDAITMYVRPNISSGMADALVRARPKAVIFNPGSENPELAAKLEAAGIRAVEACTLVLLRTNQFQSTIG